MQETSPFVIFTNIFNKLEIPYMVAGSVASMIYGEPRLTHDIDLVAEIVSESAKALPQEFSIDDFYCPPVEVMLIECGRSQRGHFNIIHHDSGFKADIYLVGKDELSRWGLSKRIRHEVFSTYIWVAPPEYVVIRKLEFYREGGSQKHVRDILSMLEVSGSRIDMILLEKNVNERGLMEVWQEVRKTK